MYLSSITYLQYTNIPFRKRERERFSIFLSFQIFLPFPFLSLISFLQLNNQFLAGHSSYNLLHLHNSRSTALSNSYILPATRHTHIHTHTRKEVWEEEPKLGRDPRLLLSNSNVPTPSSLLTDTTRV